MKERRPASPVLGIRDFTSRSPGPTKTANAPGGDLRCIGRETEDNIDRAL